jgi:hypothetical protein
VLDLHTHGALLVAEDAVELAEHLRQAREELKPFPQLLEIGVAWSIHLEIVDHRFQVGEFALEALLFDEDPATFPKLGGIDAEFRKEHLILHVGGAEGLIVVVDDADDILRGGHGSGKVPLSGRQGKRPGPMWKPLS